MLGPPTNPRGTSNWRSSADTGGPDSGPLPTPQVLTELHGDIRALPAYFWITHQCHCVVGPQARGLAASLFAKFPEANIYAERSAGQRNEDHPGTVTLHGRVINLYGQWYPGQPNHSTDSRAQRLDWFTQGLEDIARRLPREREHYLAFPQNMGCGLGGGSWPQYLQARTHWAGTVPHLKCHIMIWP